ncbi:phage tail length tape measure family protein [Amaricoccus solimangrovi]|uniref:Uncharacterized protein n=1 Tax=Amaricoccus solimangrovi TaxID=2589815 RepID=A0A501WVY7_9RHOB|nr:phage tail length tape measure family protein [Amaricoccus solimangrovi]TPE52590.1 hypothetical protein FJM51_05270 [Amaricoccus solimangrovi]
MRDLFFRIKANDETAAAFAKVRGNVKGLDGAFAGLGARIDRSTRKLKALAAATGAGLGLGMTFRDSLQLWDTQIQAQTKVETAIRSTGGAAGYTAEQLFRMASGLQNATRFGDEAILGDVTAQLLTFTNISGEVFARSQKAVLDMSTLLGSDLKGSAIMVGKALNDPIAGVSALGEAGIQFSADQKEVIKQLVATGRIATAQGMILAKLEKQFGGQAEAAARSGLGFLDQFRNAWGDLKEIVGGNLVDLARPLVGALQGIVNAFAGLPAPVQRFTVLLGLLAVAAGPVVAGIGLLVAGVAAIGAPAAIAIGAVAALGAGVLVLWDQIRPGIDWLAATVQGLSGLELAFAPVAVAAHALTDAFAAVFPEAAALVEKTVAEIVGWLTGRLGAAFDWVTAKVGAVGDAFFDLYDRVVGHSYIPDMVDGIADHMARLKGEMVDPVTAATETAGARFEDLASGVGSALGSMIRDGDFSFRGFTSRMVDLAGQMADSIVSDSFARVAEAAKALGSSSGSPGSSGGGLLSGLGSFVSGLFGGGSSAAIPGFASGGSFEVGGRGGVDRNVAVMRVSRGERVSIDRRGDTRSGAITNVYIQTPNPAAFDRSRGQVAATISRAVARGSRNL